jgi:hypothetical protein
MGNAIKSFDCREFIPKEAWNFWQNRDGNGDLGMRFINIKIPILMQFLRDSYGKPIIINNWHVGGNLDGRCYRLPDDNAYTLYSDHSRGDAVDFNVEGLTSDQVYQDMLYKYSADLIRLGVTSMEQNTEGWTHLGLSDVSLWGFSQQNGIKLIPLPARQTMGVVK